VSHPPPGRRSKVEGPESRVESRELRVSPTRPVEGRRSKVEGRGENEQPLTFDVRPSTFDLQPSTQDPRPWRVDLNLDAGERPEAIADGSEADLLALVSSVNIACGGHAGSAETMAATLDAARRLGLACGAHPGYPDRAGFGRTRMSLTHREFVSSVRDQVESLATIATSLGVELRHVKPHGALYHDAATDPAMAEAMAEALAPWRGAVYLVGLAGLGCLEVYRRHGFAVLAEAFAERRYEPDGTLRARGFPDAVIHDPAEAAAQAVRIVLQGEALAVDGSPVRLRADTLCMHSDSPAALAVIRAVRRSLEAAGVAVQAPRAPSHAANRRGRHP
jgi:5-oxoprolinase (ATP-hydrolysing) subunit A